MNIFKNIYLHLKYKSIIDRVYRDENLKDNLGRLLETTIRTDWWGRIYTVVNPNKISQSDQIYELTDAGLDNRAFVEKWLMERFIVVEKFIKASNLFDLLTYSITKIDDMGNYLIIVEPITFNDFKRSVKLLLISLTIMIIFSIIYTIIV